MGSEYENAIINAAADATSQFLAGKAGASTLPELIEANIQKAVGSSVVANTESSDPSLDHSVQSRATNLWANAYLDGGLLNSLFYRQRTPTDVAPYGFFSRDIQLRQLFNLQGNDLIQAAITSSVQKVQSTEWIIEGPKRTASAYTQMLKSGDLGVGWDGLLAKTIADYQTTDNGFFWEVIWSDGDRTEYINQAPVQGAQVVGLSHMDANRCRRTGDPLFPVLYQSLTGIMHRMHRARVIFASDLPSPNERLLGRGFCALSRALSVAAATVRYSAYRNELLDDIPPIGLLVLSGVNKAFWEQNKKEFNSQRQANEQFIFSNIMTMFAMDPSKPASANLVPFKTLWANFDEKQFWDGCIDIVSMAFGLDRQELAPINASAMGTGAQSTVLAAKSRGKGIGNLLSTFERKINLLLPESCNFRFDFHDDEQDFQAAQIRNQKIGTIISLYTASSGNPKAAPTSRQTPLAGDTLHASGANKAVGDAPPNESAQNAAQPNSNGTPPNGNAMTSYTPPAKETLINWDEARWLIAHEIPEWADILDIQPEEDDAMYDDSTSEPVLDTEDENAKVLTKTYIEKKYGKKVKIYGKSGKVVEERLHTGKHKRGYNYHTPSHLSLTNVEVEKAKHYLHSIGIEMA